MLEDAPPAGLPADEAERLLALRESAFLESGTDLMLEAVVHRAAMLFNVPMAAVSLRDETRQVFKASIGLGLPFAAGDLAFCGDAALCNGPFFVLNARLDPRFAGNAVVQGRPGIRFYAAAPVVGPRQRPFGALCVMDRRSRPEVAKEELAALEALAAEVSSIFATPGIEMKPERGW